MQRQTTQLLKLKIPLEGINSRISKAEEWIGELEDKMVAFWRAEYSKKNEKNWG